MSVAALMLNYASLELYPKRLLWVASVFGFESAYTSACIQYICGKGILTTSDCFAIYCACACPNTKPMLWNRSYVYLVGWEAGRVSSKHWHIGKRTSKAVCLCADVGMHSSESSCSRAGP
jgi:hypothetical protein